MAEIPVAPVAFVDAHVHIYDCFQVGALLDAASKNFQREATRLRLNEPHLGCLLLAETSRDHWFQRLLELATHRRFVGGWRLSSVADDNCAVMATGGNRQRLVLVAGRQVVTRQGLEILALITRETFEDGAATEAILAAILKADALAVLPWGVGKWLGQRGRTIRQLMTSPAAEDLFLGDIFGRPTFWPRPRLFSSAAPADAKILPGSDPLPLPWQETKPGCYGFAIEGPISLSKPAQDLKILLRHCNAAKIRAYGRRERALDFFRNQASIRLGKHSKRRENAIR